MDYKEIEEKLKESVGNTEKREFSTVWEDIKDEIKTRPNTRKRRIQWAAIASAASVVILSAIIIPVALNNQPSGDVQTSNTESSKEDVKYYLSDNLDVKLLGIDELYQKFASVGANLIDVRNNEIETSNLFYVVEDGEELPMGCTISYLDDLDNPTFYVVLTAYREMVEVKNWNPTMQEEKTHTVNQTQVRYWVEHFDGETYVYKINATHKSVNYYMEYTCFEENIKPFLDEFFK